MHECCHLDTHCPQPVHCCAATPGKERRKAVIRANWVDHLFKVIMAAMLAAFWIPLTVIFLKWVGWIS